MTDYAARLPIPAPGSINSGLTYCRPETVLDIFGQPATPLPTECGQPTSPRLKAALITADVGPFRVTGLRPAVESLTRVFAQVKAEKPELYDVIGTAGMLCVRCVRGYPGVPSNHAFGAAIDLKINGELVPLGGAYVQAGILELYAYMHAEGWYWGAGWARPDAMHFEASDQLMRRWEAEGLLDPVKPPAVVVATPKPAPPVTSSPALPVKGRLLVNTGQGVWTDYSGRKLTIRNAEEVVINASGPDTWVRYLDKGE
ncbi:M15 family metallopeptidase [Deinococcus humi]|uniref:Peptidase M15C domain-containing protein n=1 Tax=Deinococcus humi TaxID=662880 RepID=A0A7W8JQG3_9DEIO|nr:M15 family metallopeptidase [Deinococcus humi]MBB5361311.1 hypothetical protein [Deinococcus humi]GGO19434.1 hypothetical protein GCM10008949_03770 [Deinococcus humi]